MRSEVRDEVRGVGRGEADLDISRVYGEGEGGVRLRRAELFLPV